MADEKPRPLYVYRLVVEYPDGIDWTNPPALWVEEFGDVDTGRDDATGAYLDPPTFHWPNRRHYLSMSGAKLAAERLRSYGCVVGINRSETVEWVEP